MSTESVIRLKKSSIPEKVPLVGDLEHGELALNFADGRLYFKNSSNEIASFNSSLEDDDLIQVNDLQNNDLLVFNGETSSFQNVLFSDVFSIPLNLNQDFDLGFVFDSITDSQDLGFVFDSHTSSFNWGELVLSGLFSPDQLILPTFTISTLPEPNVPAQLIFVSDEIDGSIVAFSDGQDWRRLTDRQIVA